jgi:soluble lytic murein transglycosylase-like protein
LILPSDDVAVSPKPSGEVIGKRINFVDGGFINVDEVWKQGDSTWYRYQGTSQSVSREIKNVEDRYKSVSAPAPNPVETPKAPVRVVTWIYLKDGARLKVDDVREAADGTWYNRGNLNIFLAKDRVDRVEREDPNGPPLEDLKDQSWSSGNSVIDSHIRKHANRFGVDPYLVFLVIEQESHFHPRALSPKGAQGLMQLMPGTARRFGVSRPFDAGENIRGGTQYLKELLTMFKGRVDLALASYNAGEGRVLDYGNRVPPFKETQNYVRQISNRYRRKAGTASTGARQ